MSIIYQAGSGAFEEMINWPIDALFQNYKYLSSVVVNQETQSLNPSAWYLQARFIQLLSIMQSRVQDAPLNVLLNYATNTEEPASDAENRPIFCLTIKEICMKEILRRYFRDSICNCVKKE